MTTPDLNLTAGTRRAPGSVWERDGWNGNPQRLTLGRWLVGLGGAALAAQGFRQRTMAGGLLAGLGCGIAWWALAGEGDLSEARRRIGNAVDRWRAEDPVDEASAASFPASDAPSTPSAVTVR
jgi:hypothetical protein